MKVVRPNRNKELKRAKKLGWKLGIILVFTATDPFNFTHVSICFLSLCNHASGRESHIQVARIQLHLLLQLREQLVVEGLQLQHTHTRTHTRTRTHTHTHAHTQKPQKTMQQRQNELHLTLLHT